MKYKRIIAAVMVAAALAGAVPSAEAVKPAAELPLIGCRLYSRIPLSYRLQQKLGEACKSCGVPLQIALAVAEYESGFDAEREYTNSVGLMGIPREFNAMYGAELGEISDPLDAGENLRAGVALLGYLHELYGRWDMSLTAYAIGERAAENYVFPYSTDSEYSDRIMALAEVWAQVLR